MLHRHNMHRSGEPDATRSYLNLKELTFSPLGKKEDTKGYSGTINTIYGDRLYLSYMDFGAPVEIGAPENSYGYSISIPLTGQMRISSAGETIDCNQARTIFGSPQPNSIMQLDRDARVLTLTINRAALNRQFEVLTGQAHQGTIFLQPDTDLTRGIGEFINCQMRFLVDAEEAGVSVFDHRLRKTNFEDAILNAILLYLPHSHSHKLDSPSYAIVPGDVKRTIDFIHANLNQPLRLADLVRIAGIPGRTLNTHFREFAGQSPMTYLSNMRLRHAHELLKSGKVKSVLQAALESGFVHPSRFAEQYRKFYGELPSQTIKKNLD